MMMILAIEQTSMTTAGQLIDRHLQIVTITQKSQTWVMAAKGENLWIFLVLI